MALHTIDSLRLVARGKDKRLEDVNKYPDSWIDDKIDHAFETAESGRQVFTNEEVIDLKPFIVDGVEKLEISMENEVHNYYDILATQSRDIYVKIKNDNTLSVELNIPNLENLEEDVNITCRYFYYPKLPFESIFMKPEVYHFFRHCLYVNLYGSLRDKENETYHQAQVDRFIADGSFGVPNDFATDTPIHPNFDLQDRYI